MTESPNETEGGEPGGAGSRMRSKISFPYTPLVDAEQVAEALHRRGDTSTTDEIAAELGQKITSGAFRTKMSTARTFGAIDVRRGQVSLSPLGRRLIDPAQAAKARVDAFLHVPLYHQIYEKYKGVTLPSNAGIEHEMQRLGVSPKQTERARQALQRSAERAGFFGNGTDRLVSPVLADPGPSDKTDLHEDFRRRSGGVLAPAVEALMVQLLEDGADWSPERVIEWVGAARTIYGLS